MYGTRGKMEVTISVCPMNKLMKVTLGKGSLKNQNNLGICQIGDGGFYKGNFEKFL